MPRLSFRALCALGFAACTFAMAFAYFYLERTRGYEPCPMCIFQRVAMVAAGLVFLIGAIQGPKEWGRWVYGVLAGLMAAGGAAIAARHVWLQHLPEDQVPSCGPTLKYLLDMLPFTDVVAKVLRGDANCAKIDAEWLGLALPTWTMVAFIGLALYALAAPALARKAAA